MWPFACSRAKSYATSGALGADVDLRADLGGRPSSFLRVGLAGDVAIVTSFGDTVTIYAVAVGERIEVSAVKLLAAGTSAQKISVFG